MSLAGKVVFVTGGGRGIGRGIAEAVADAGADVGVGDLDTALASDTAREVERRGRRALAVPLDVTASTSVEGAVDAVVRTWGRLDGWVNNAGLIKMDAALDVSAADWDAQLAVNLSALFACCQIAARHMLDHGGGAIVNVASNAGKVGYRNMAAYNASKAGVISVTRSLAQEWAEHGINVNAVCPGGVETPMLAGVADWLGPRLGVEPGQLLAQMKPQQMARHVQPIEVGRVVAFLLCDDARIIRGQAINADGGDTPY